MTWPHDDTHTETVLPADRPAQDTPEMREIDPARTQNDDLAALKARVQQLEAEAEARDAAQRRADELDREGVPSGGAPLEFFHHLIDGTVVRAFGYATHIANGDAPPLRVLESHAVPIGYDDHYDAVRRDK